MSNPIHAQNSHLAKNFAAAAPLRGQIGQAVMSVYVDGHVLKDSMGSIQRALDKSYADLNSGNPSATQHLSSAS
jgi:hypothetical protein